MEKAKQAVVVQSLKMDKLKKRHLRSASSESWDDLVERASAQQSPCDVDKAGLTLKQALSASRRAVRASVCHLDQPSLSGPYHMCDGFIVHEFVLSNFVHPVHNYNFYLSVALFLDYEQKKLSAQLVIQEEEYYRLQRNAKARAYAQKVATCGVAMRSCKEIAKDLCRRLAKELSGIHRCTHFETVEIFHLHYLWFS